MKMVFNGSEKIDDDGGDFLLLTDYGQEGFAVSHQNKTLEGALAAMAEGVCGVPMTLVKLVRVDATECA